MIRFTVTPFDHARSIVLNTFLLFNSSNWDYGCDHSKILQEGECLKFCTLSQNVIHIYILHMQEIKVLTTGFVVLSVAEHA